MEQFTSPLHDFVQAKPTPVDASETKTTDANVTETHQDIEVNKCILYVLCIQDKVCAIFRQTFLKIYLKVFINKLQVEKYTNE